MQYRLDLVLKPSEGALLRVIGTAERRGFQPVSINGQPSAADGGRWHVALVVDGQRSGETLRHQLEKVYDCVSVQVTEVAATAQVQGVAA